MLTESPALATGHRRYGANDGALAVYFHGAPGAPEEAAAFDDAARSAGVTLICVDRFACDPTLVGEAYYRALAQAILALADGRRVDLIGFSLGGFVALQTCRHLGGAVRRLHLVSAAAPLETGDFLDAMAGKPVFQAARASPFGFRLMSLWQGWLARHAPGALFRLLFASAAGADRALAADPSFRAAIVGVLRASLTAGQDGYIRDVRAYVRPWADSLADVGVETCIWHGDADNWAPVGMARALAHRLPGRVQVEILPGLSHYSCLYQALPEILRQVGQAES